MKIIVDIKDDKVSFMMEVLKNFKSVKSVNLSEKEKKIKHIKEAIEEMNLIKAGKRQARNAEDFINEL